MNSPIRLVVDGDKCSVLKAGTISFSGWIDPSRYIYSTCASSPPPIQLNNTNIRRLLGTLIGITIFSSIHTKISSVTSIQVQNYDCPSLQLTWLVRWEIELEVLLFRAGFYLLLYSRCSHCIQTFIAFVN